LPTLLAAFRFRSARTTNSPKYGLPRAISNHNNYWYWGPRDYTGDIVIVLGSDGTGDREHFRIVEAAGRMEHPYSRRDEHFTIWLCRGLKHNLQDLWSQMRIIG
jgi:hypothetical protein